MILFTMTKIRLNTITNKEFESIVTTLSSMKVYDENLIKSDSLISIINRSIREIQDENRELSKLKGEHSELQRKLRDYDEIKQNFLKLQMKYNNLTKNNKLDNTKKHLRSLIKSKLMAFKNELSFIKSSFQSELSILKSCMESVFSNFLLKQKEVSKFKLNGILE